MPLFATVQPGITVTSTTVIDESVLNRLGTPTIDITGEVDGSSSVSIASGTVTNAMLANMTGMTVKGVRTGTTAPADVTVDNSTLEIGYPSSVDTLRVKDSGITTAKLATATGASDGVTYAKVQQVAASRLLGNPTGSLAAPSEISLGTGLAFSGTTLGFSAAGLSVKYVNSVVLTTVLSLPSGVETDITNLTITLTPASTSSKFAIHASINGATTSSSAVIGIQLKRGGSAISGATGTGGAVNATGALGIGDGQTRASSNYSMLYVDSPATVASTTYKLTATALTADGYINAPYQGGSSSNNVVTISTMTIFEIL